jgi:DNA-binding CsgD family transcriptional regulator
LLISDLLLNNVMSTFRNRKPVIRNTWFNKHISQDMKVHYLNPGKKVSAKPCIPKIRNITSLFDANINVKEVNDGIVLQIRFDGSQVKDFFDSFIRKAFTEPLRSVEHVNETYVKELPVRIISKAPVFQVDNRNSLTIREFEIIEKLSGGMQNKELADTFGLCINTIKSHLQNIYNKIGVENRTEATVWYLKSSDKYVKTISNE